MTSSTRFAHTPQAVSRPGETLLDLLEEWSMTQSELANRLGRSLKSVNEIIKGKASITPETALLLERVFGTPAQFWNTREQKYQEHLAQKQEIERLKAEQSWLKKFPLKDMVSLGWIGRGASELETLKQLWSFFGVTGPDPWQQVYASGVAYRKSPTFKGDPAVVAAWLRRGEILAHARRCASFDSKKFRQALVEIRSLSRSTPEVYVPRMQELCAQAGVAVVFVPELPKTCVSGVARWLSPTKALIQLSLRYKADDHLWFTFFHEAGHILLHGKKETFLELDGKVEEDEREAEANTFACNTLIPSPLYETLRCQRPMSRARVESAAAEWGIAPGIVVGRLQHDSVIHRSHLNDLKVGLKWSNSQ